ncbi:MAG: hypothetical protein ACKO85_06195 [Isosphaeraceae bacterium]
MAIRSQVRLSIVRRKGSETSRVRLNNNPCSGSKRAVQRPASVGFGKNIKLIEGEIVQASKKLLEILNPLVAGSNPAGRISQGKPKLVFARWKIPCHMS